MGLTLDGPADEDLEKVVEILARRDPAERLAELLKP